MAANSSSSSFYSFQHCSDVRVGSLISLFFIITNVSLLLPLCLLVLHLGHRQWRQQRCLATTSHSDIFTYHFAAMELVFAAGAIFYFVGQNFGLPGLIKVGLFGTATFYPAQISFHTLTCVERYLAVVHPIIYLRLRQPGGVRIRNISIGCAWLLYSGWIGVEALYFPDVPYVPVICALVVSLVIVSFCSLSVLCVLTRPGPGAKAGNSERVDQSKQRAFNTIIAITGMQWLFIIGLFVCVALDNWYVMSYSAKCLVLASASWFSLPSSLVLPLLFLHRAGKLVCCYSRYD